mmetsp:Transcript_4282/g.5977  ORF Transcript_4282/g.5977 Transcript_4282/m.5977 type:complete len:439 (-) Transcript_4282:15-1331(-)
MVSSDEVSLYLQYVDNASFNRNGHNLAVCFNLDRRLQAIDDQALIRGLNQLEIISTSIIRDKVIGSVTVFVLKAMLSLAKSEIEKAAQEYIDGLKKLSEAIMQQQRNENEKNSGFWMVPTLKLMVKQAYLLVKRADHNSSNSNQTDSIWRLYHSVLMYAFNVSCTGESEECWDQSAKLGALCIINHLLRVLIKLGTLKSCFTILTRLQICYWPEHEDPPRQGQNIPGHLLCKSEMIAYHYYTGRLKLLQDDFTGARSDLMEALARCPKTAIKNKQRILITLVPLNISFGRIPTIHILEKYNLMIFSGFVKALKLGSISSFNKAINDYQLFFIKTGTFLMLEKMKLAVYRSFLKRHINFFQTQENIETGKSPILNLLSVQKALAIQGEAMEMEELECLLSNLITLDLVKGYISHSSKKLVLAKNLADAFPLRKVLIPLS